MSTLPERPWRPRGEARCRRCGKALVVVPALAAGPILCYSGATGRERRITHPDEREETIAPPPRRSPSFIPPAR